MRRPLFFLTVLLFAVGFARGQGAPAPDQTEQIKALLARVDLLEKHVAELRATQAASAASAAPPPAATMKPAPSADLPASQPASMQEHGGQVPQEAMQQLETRYPSLQIRGVADVDFSAKLFLNRSWCTENVISLLPFRAGLV